MAAWRLGNRGVRFDPSKRSNSDAGDDGVDNGNGGDDGDEAGNGSVAMAGGGDAGDDVTSVVAAPKKKGRARGGKKAQLGRKAYKSAMQE